MKLKDISKNRVLPTGIDGIYIRDLPMAQYDKLFKDAPERLQEEDGGLIVEIFNDVVCDADGNVFEDIPGASFEEISEMLSLNLMFDIVHSIPEAITPKGVDLGNLKETGKRK